MPTPEEKAAAVDADAVEETGRVTKTQIKQAIMVRALHLAENAEKPDDLFSCTQVLNVLDPPRPQQIGNSAGSQRIDEEQLEKAVIKVLKKVRSRKKSK